MASAAPTPIDLGEVIRSVTLPALAGWAIPGLGHVMLGQKMRGGILFAVITTLFVGGVFLGGIDTFDTSKSGLVAWCQIGLAPCLPASLAVKSAIAASNRLSTPPSFTPGLGKSEEQGWVFTGTAGLLNMLAILDLVLREPRRRGGGAGDAGGANSGSEGAAASSKGPASATGGGEQQAGAAGDSAGASI